MPVASTGLRLLLFIGRPNEPDGHQGEGHDQPRRPRSGKVDFGYLNLGIGEFFESE